MQPIYAGHDWSCLHMQGLYLWKVSMGAELINRGDKSGPKQRPDYKADVGDVVPHPDLYRQ
jgi:hypothetical protein